MYLEVSRTVAAPIESVWAFLSNFGNGDKVYTLIDSSKRDGVGVGAVAENVMGDRTIRELCVQLDPERFVLAYTVTESSAPSGVRDYVSTVKLTYVSYNTCNIHWSCHYKWVPLAGGHDSPAEAEKYIKQVYAVCIDDLERAGAAYDGR